MLSCKSVGRSAGPFQQHTSWPSSQGDLPALAPKHSPLHGQQFYSIEPQRMAGQRVHAHLIGCMVQKSACTRKAWKGGAASRKEVVASGSPAAALQAGSSAGSGSKGLPGGARGLTLFRQHPDAEPSSLPEKRKYRARAGGRCQPAWGAKARQACRAQAAPCCKAQL